MKTGTVITACAFVALLLSAAAGAQNQTPPLGLTKIPAPDGSSDFGGQALDAQGNVFGGAQLSSGFNLIKWIGGTTPVAYPRLPADQNNTGIGYSFSAVNAAGLVVGLAGAEQFPFTSKGIYWDASKHPFAVAQSGELHGISDSGVIAGQLGRSTGSTAAYWASPSSQPVLLPYPTQIDCAVDPEKDCYSWTSAISPNGKYIVGASSRGDYHSDMGILWANGTQVANYSDWDVIGSRVTNAGVVIGSHRTPFESDTPPELYKGHAFIWEAGTLTDLGCLPGAPPDTTFRSNATAINSSGVIVGSSEWSQTSYVRHAVMWVNGQIIDLNSSLGSQLPAGWTLESAIDINDAGEILLLASNDETSDFATYLAKPLITTHTTITSNINPSTYGQQIHLIAKVSPDSGPVPTVGNVSWYDNGVLLGTARLTSIGTSSWEPSTWTGGVHEVTAEFPGSSTLGTSTSPIFKQTVNAASTRTTVSASINPATHGQPVQLIATVVPSSGTIAGTVTFKSGSSVLGTGTLDGRTKQAYFTTTFAKGTYAITAVFGGSQNFVASNSSTLTLTVK